MSERAGQRALGCMAAQQVSRYRAKREVGGEPGFRM